MSDSPIRWASIDKIRVGDDAALLERVTVELVAETVKVTGDYNPVHSMRPRRSIRESRTVVHGGILLGAFRG